MSLVAQRARDALSILEETVSEMAAKIESLKTQVQDSKIRATDAEARSMSARSVANLMTDKASRTDDLETACRRLLAAFDRLPVRMEDAGMMQMVVKPEIPLYGTHEWKALVDAKLALVSVMGKQEPEGAPQETSAA